MKIPFFRTRSWSISDIEPPWGSRPSIYWHVLNSVKEDELGLPESADELPDELIIRGDNQFSWAPGAMDGVFGHHAGGSEDEKNVHAVVRSLRKLTRDSTTENSRHLYSRLTEGTTLSLIDNILQAIIDSTDIDGERLHTLVRWLAMEAADREAVKFAIAVLGLFRDREDRDVLMTLGRHEEFTLFVAVAFQNYPQDVEDSLWKLAQHVNGWGRIHLVERLAETDDAYIKDWLLREGYRNSIMYEYTALPCAKGGDLLAALNRDSVDDELLEGCGEILATLLQTGGPAAGIEEYSDGAEAVERYLELIAARANTLKQRNHLEDVRLFLNETKTLTELPESIRSDWEKRRDRILHLVNVIVGKPDWNQKLQEGLNSTDREIFWVATRIADHLKVDIWENLFARIQNGEDHWFQAMQTDDPARIQTLVEYAERTLPLNEIATGPTESIGLGSEFQQHMILDWVLQGLQRFPGVGRNLILAGLKSSVVRNRNMALNALREWEPELRDAAIVTALTDGYEIEPAEQTKELFGDVIKLQ